MMRKLSTDMLTYGAADSCGSAIRFLLIILLTRSLTPDDFGHLAIIAVTMLLLFATLPLALPSALMTRFSPENTATNNALKNQVFFTTLCLWGAAVLCAGCVVYSDIFDSRFWLPLFPWLCLWLLGGMAYQIPASSLRFHRRVKRFAAVAISGPIIMSAYIINAYMHGSVTIGTIVKAEALGVLTQLVVAYSTDVYMPRWTAFAEIMSLLRQGTALMTAFFSKVLIDASDRYIIYFLLGSTAAGYYSVAARFALLGAVIVEAFNSMWLPYVFGQLRSTPDHAMLFKQGRFFFFATTAGIVALICVCPALITFRIGTWYFIDPLYHEVWPLAIMLLFPFICKAGYFLYTPWLTYYQRHRALIAMNYSAAALSMGGSVVIAATSGATPHLALGGIALMATLAYGLCWLWARHETRTTCITH